MHSALLLFLGALCRIVIGVMFVYAGGMKLRSKSWMGGAQQVGVPPLFALVLPVVEITLGAFLVLGVARPFVPWAAVILLLLFTTFLFLQLLFRKKTPCHCFGEASSQPVGTLSVARNLVFLALAICGALW